MKELGARQRALSTRAARDPARRSSRLIFLAGFMGAGKTSVGRALARRLKCRFFDLDDLIVARARRSIAQIFSEQGEAAFRRAETAALRRLLHELGPRQTAVIAVGGGAFIQPGIRALLRASGAPVVFLQASADELLARCKAQAAAAADGRPAPVRPLLRDQNQFRQLYEERRLRYLEAEFHVSTSGRSIAQVAAEVARTVRSRNVAPEVR
ncbi:MAG TPA: shikimate kinase [Terriglobales bacterium]|nr:shikimate kinase [Terriglobales bacterium]